MTILRNLLAHNWLKNIYYNFKLLPFRQAIKMPIDIAGNTRINIEGKLMIRSSHIYGGMISIGFQGCDMFPDYSTNLLIKGSMEVYGKTRIGRGSVINISRTGRLLLQDNSRIGARAVIVSEDIIEIGKNSGLSWDCQIMDTDTHSIVNLLTNEIYFRHKPVYIGQNVWIGNHVLINKGTIIPDNTIVSSNSLCNKDYTSLIESNCVIGGIPAKKIAENRARNNDKLT